MQELERTEAGISGHGFPQTFATDPGAAATPLQEQRMINKLSLHCKVTRYYHTTTSNITTRQRQQQKQGRTANSLERDTIINSLLFQQLLSRENLA